VLINLDKTNRQNISVDVNYNHRIREYLPVSYILCAAIFVVEARWFCKHDIINGQLSYYFREIFDSRARCGKMYIHTRVHIVHHPYELKKVRVDVYVQLSRNNGAGMKNGYWTMCFTRIKGFSLTRVLS